MDISPVSTDLKPAHFVRLAAQRVGASCGSSGVWRFNIRSHLFQCWRGDSAANHYEVWIHERTNKIELGAHFEGPAEANNRFYEYLDAHLLEIHAALGTTIWLERWDKGWVRLYETAPMLPLDEVKVEDVAARLCIIIATVQPILDHMAANNPHKP